MTDLYQEASVRGQTVRLPAIQVGDRTLVIRGSVVRIAALHDSEFVEGEMFPEPEAFLHALGNSGSPIDILTFSQRVYEKNPKLSYTLEWDNAAVARTESFSEWWESLPQESRKNVRRAAKRGVSVAVSALDDEFVKGIQGIYDESPVRQGRRFWHFGKDLATIRRENASYLDRSVFIGAYHGDELIGFMKFVRVDKAAVIMQILTKVSHNDKRPMNALIAKAVEVCAEKNLAYLVYSRMTYGNKLKSDIAEFKRRNGFGQMDFPRYFVPLTLKGRVAIALGLHRGVLGVLPPYAIHFLWHARAKLVGWRAGKGQVATAIPAAERSGGTAQQ